MTHDWDSLDTGADATGEGAPTMMSVAHEDWTEGLPGPAVIAWIPLFRKNAQLILVPLALVLMLVQRVMDGATLYTFVPWLAGSIGVTVAMFYSVLIAPRKRVWVYRNVENSNRGVWTLEWWEGAEVAKLPAVARWTGRTVSTVLHCVDATNEKEPIAFDPFTYIPPGEAIPALVARYSEQEDARNFDNAGKKGMTREQVQQTILGLVIGGLLLYCYAVVGRLVGQ